jgi:hypothetical protein
MGFEVVRLTGRQLADEASRVLAVLRRTGPDHSEDNEAQSGRHGMARPPAP